MPPGRLPAQSCLSVMFRQTMAGKLIYLLKETLYLIFDYPYKYYTFKLFEV